MSRLSSDMIADEIRAKGFEPVDISEYRNLRSSIIVECDMGHEIETSLSEVRKASFKCERCGGGNVSGMKMPPQKKGERVIGVDNATHSMGISVFDDGELVHYNLLNFSGADFDDRLQTIFNTLERTIIEDWQPDYIVFEDIQYQNNYDTYKRLSMLLGLLVVAAKNGGVNYDIVPPVTWRSHFGISGRRATVKARAISIVSTKYGVNVNDDIAEAILIGQYFVDNQVNTQEIKKAF